MIVFRGVTVFGTAAGYRRPLLDNVSAVFDSQGTIGILGERGSGKSTLLRLLGRWMKPDGGRVLHDGSTSWLLNSLSALNTRMTVRANIRFTAMLYRVPCAPLIQQVDRLGDVRHYLDEILTNVPRDVRCRVVYSLCLALGFDHYLADGSLFIGDPPFRERCEDYIDRLRRRRSLIIATHHPALIRRHCGVTYLLRDGDLRRYDDPETAIRDFQSS